MKRVLVVLAFALAVSASALSAINSDPKGMVLPLKDLPPGFGITREGPNTTPWTASGQSIPRRGYVRLFERTPVVGLDVVESVADVYRSRAAAHTAFLDMKKKDENVVGDPGEKWLRVRLGFPLGDEAFAWHRQQKLRDGSVSVDYVIVWRYQTVIGRVETWGVGMGTESGSGIRSDTLLLTNRQQARIKRTLS